MCLIGEMIGVFCKPITYRPIIFEYDYRQATVLLTEYVTVKAIPVRLAVVKFVGRQRVCFIGQMVCLY